jgi:UDP-N-acetyl-D-glucosamine dehydrogenase
MKKKSTTETGRGIVGIVGLGFVGLPLAILFVRKGFDVIGIDLDERKIESIQAGRSYIRDVTDGEIEQAVSAGKLSAATDYTALSAAGSIIVCVPTPLSPANEPDLHFLIGACTRLSPVLKPGQLIVIESSTYPGTTRETLQPILEQSGLEIGRQLYLAYSPERIDPGNGLVAAEQIPKVISGVTERCLEQVRKLYGRVFDRLVAVSTTEAAEMTKLLENAYRLVNISFINEFAQICGKLNVNVWEVIHAAATKPYGFGAFYPGPGVGGHCIPVDPLYLQWKAAQLGISSRLIELSRQINESMPAYIVQQVQAHLGKKLSESRILLYGITYKKDTPDIRESAAIPLIRLFRSMGAQVSYHDPYIPTLWLDEGTELSSIALTAEALKDADCVVIVTDHSVIPVQLIAEHGSFVYDTRNVIPHVKESSKLVKLGDGTAE